ncbi:hypothetical protein LTR94_034432, partial [Friedmanniomyces endolithicus]
IRDRRLAPLRQGATRVEVAAAGRESRRQAGLCRQGRHRFHPATHGRTPRITRRPWAQDRPRRSPPRDGARRALGPPRSGRRNRLYRDDARWPAPPSQLHRPAQGQTRRAGGRGTPCPRAPRQGQR